MVMQPHAVKLNGENSPVTEPLNQPELTLSQQATLLLWQRVNTSLLAYYKLTKAFESAENALTKSADEWASLGIHAKHIKRHQSSTAELDNAFITSIIQSIQTDSYKLLFLDDANYPSQLQSLFDPPPILFYRGNSERLAQAQIAIVGSRKPTPEAQKITFDMAQYLAQAGYVITSGLAQGVDAQAHLGALAQPSEQSGRTVGVMGTGIDVCYPKQHQALFDRIVNEGGCLVSELLPGTPPNKHTFPRRNRIVAGLSLGTIVTEAALQSGSLITARLTSEQGKQVFAIPSSINNNNAEGCHHLIREGATLVYHPEQVLSDISSQILSPNMRQALDVLPIQSTQSTHNVQHSNMANASKPDTGLSQSQPFKAKLSNKTSTVHSGESAPQSIDANKYQNEPYNHPQNRQQKHHQENLYDHEKSQALQQHIIPEHLQTLWVHIDWKGQDLDALVAKTGATTPELLSQLMELELLGAIQQIGGRYKRL